MQNVGRAALNCYVPKALPLTSEVSAHSTQAMHGIYIAKTKFVTLLSTKMLRENCHSCREELVMEQYHTFLLPLSSYSGCCKHRLSQNTARHALFLLEVSYGIAKGRCHASAWNKISAAFYTFSKLRLSIQVDFYSPSPANLPVSKCYASAA